MVSVLLKLSCTSAKQAEGEMNILLKLLPHQLPAFVRKAILAELSAATAEAFACPAPSLARLSCDKCLESYARFSSAQAERARQSGPDVSIVKARLYRNAYPLGEKLRRWFGLATIADVMALGQILYRAIGVEMQGDARGNVTVQNCFYSQFYSGQVCHLISALDDGVFAGLSGGCRLSFSQRLTEGYPCCRARLQAGRH